LASNLSKIAYFKALRLQLVIQIYIGQRGDSYYLALGQPAFANVQKVIPAWIIFVIPNCTILCMDC
jgi:hypothetical protein